jgi:hypothetical protein
VGIGYLNTCTTGWVAIFVHRDLTSNGIRLEKMSTFMSVSAKVLLKVLEKICCPIL